MFIEKRKITPQKIKRISIIANIIIIVLFILLFFAFWYIQILRNFYYTELATRNIKKEIEIKAPRGLILDRNYKRLSGNKINFKLFLIREYAKNLDKSIGTAAAFTGLGKN